MYVQVTCPTCKQSAVFPASANGGIADCAHCRTRFRVSGVPVAASEHGSPRLSARSAKASKVPRTLIGAAVGALAMLVIVTLGWLLLRDSGQRHDAYLIEEYEATTGATTNDEKDQDLRDAWMAKYKPDLLARDADDININDDEKPVVPTPLRFDLASTDGAEDVARQEPVKELADLVELVEPAVVRINTVGVARKGMGSGFLIDGQGLVLTNYHVIKSATTATVVFHDGRTTRVMGYRVASKSKDLAILQIMPQQDPNQYLRLAPNSPRKGVRVAAFGAPLGLSFSMSEGIVSALRTPQELLRTNLDLNVRWIQTTAPISPGNSGGPLVNMRGEVVGVNAAASKEGAQNLNFAIDAEEIRNVLRQATVMVSPLSALEE